VLLDGDRSRRPAISAGIAMAILLLVTVSAFLVEIGSGVTDTSSLRSASNVARWTLDDAYFSCLTHQVESLVPGGKRVWVSQFTPNGTGDAITLEKVVAPYAPLSYGPKGVVRLFLVATHRPKGCLGVRVKAVAPDGAVRFGSGSLAGSLPLPGQRP
jgi:hypothetical protein